MDSKIHTLLAQATPLPITGSYPRFFRGLESHNRPLVTRTIVDGSMILFEVFWPEVAPFGSTLDKLATHFSESPELLCIARFGLN